MPWLFPDPPQESSRGYRYFTLNLQRFPETARAPPLLSLINPTKPCQGMQTTVKHLDNTYIIISLWDLSLAVLGVHIGISQFELMNVISAVILESPTLAKRNNVPAKDKSWSFHLFLDQIGYNNTYDQNKPPETVSCRAASVESTIVTRHPPRRNE